MKNCNEPTIEYESLCNDPMGCYYCENAYICYPLFDETVDESSEV